MLRLLLLLTLVPIAASGCSLFGLDGCTDRNALNFEPNADNNDGSCSYSRVVFYRVADGPSARVTVDDVIVGTVSVSHPDGPANCATPGTAQYQIRDGDVHEWAAEAGSVVNSGTVRAERFTSCIEVQVF